MSDELIKQDQIGKFRVKFSKLLMGYDEEFYNRWDKNLEFLPNSQNITIPCFSGGFLETLPSDILDKYEKLRLSFLLREL